MALSPVAQGTLNRLRASIIVPNYPNLNITSPFMGKQFVRVQFKGAFDNLIPTGTGAVTSPEPYVETDVTVSLLRTQALGTSWRVQWESQSDLGQLAVVPDTTAYATINLDTCVIRNVDLGAFDGTDPVVRLTLSGIYYINNNQWSL